MVDEADRGSDTEQFLLDVSLSAARRQVPREAATGRCLWCEELVAEGVRFCDSDCAADSDKYERRR